MESKRRVTQATFARLIGVSRQRVNVMIAEGLRTEPDGMIDRERGLAWVRKNIASTSKPVAGTGRSLIDIRCESELLKIELLRIELAAKQGQFVALGDVERVWLQMVGACRARILSIPSKIAPIVYAAESVDSASAILEASLHEALNELAEGLPDDEPPAKQKPAKQKLGRTKRRKV